MLISINSRRFPDPWTPHTQTYHPNNHNKQEQFQLERTANRIVATTQAPVPGSSGSGSAPTHAHAHAHRGNASGAQAQFEKEEREERARAEKRAAQRGVRDKVCGCDGMT